MFCIVQTSLQSEQCLLIVLQLSLHADIIISNILVAFINFSCKPVLV